MELVLLGSMHLGAYKIGVQCEEITFSFDLDDFSQKRILEGLDKIDITLGYTDQIDSFSKSRKNWMPKLV